MNRAPIRVLLIEDNPGDARLIREMLAEVEGAPFDLECAERLSDGLARVSASSIDAVLLDLSLPDSQGADTFARLHAHAPRIPIVVMTGHEDEALGVQLVERGAQEYLVKGQVTSPLLARAIRYAIERRRGAEALRESERKLRLIAENTTDVIFAYNMDRRLIYVNPAVEQLTGYSVAELQEKNFINWLHPGDEAGTMRRWEELFAGKSFQGEEFRIVTKDGQVKWCLSSWGPLCDENGQQIGIQGRERDITERKRAEGEIRDARDAVLNMLEDLDKTARQVQASEEQYRTLVENASELIWALDPEGRFIFANTQAERVSGLKIAEWIGKSFAPLIAPPEDLPRIQQIVLETLGGKTSSYEVGVYRADGSIICLSVNTTPLYRDGKIVGTISFGRDVTAQKEAEAAAQQRMTELSALFEVSSALRGAKTPDEMLPIILKTTIEVIRSDGGVILLRDSATGELVARAGEGVMMQRVGTRLKINDNVPSRVLATREPYIIPHAPTEPLIPPELRERMQHIESAIVLPLQVGETAVGVMNIAYTTSHTFTESEVRLLTAITDMAASAIHRASLFEQLEHRVHELSTLFDVGKMVTASLRVQDVLEFIVGAASRAVYAEGCSLFLWDEREQRLVMRAVVGGAPELVNRVKYRSGEGMVGWVFLERRGVNVSDVAADPRWKPEPEQEQTLPSKSIHTVLAAPLRIGEKILGVLAVSNKTHAPHASPEGSVKTRGLVESAGVGAPAFTASDESLLTALASEVAISIENARLYEDVRGLSIATIRSLATAIDARDPYTRGHSDGVAHLSVQLAHELGWSGADLEMLEFAALLHDVGKIAVPDAILRKTEPLTPDEWIIIRLHPFHSAQIIKPVEPLQRIVPWVYHHQERWDGTGYPDGIKGEAIPLAARIIAVVDAFNAMTTDRPYRRALTREKAVAELRRCAGMQFDPRVAEIFLRLLERGHDITGG